jgi:ribosomal protein S18 acetylase RimI-like enzyme
MLVITAAGTPLSRANRTPARSLVRARLARQTRPVELIEVTGREALVDEAAQTWAEATAARDGGRVPSLDLARPVIQAVLDRSPRSFLLVLRSPDGTPAGARAGFAAVEPVPGAVERAAEVSFLGVRPAAWGHGVGEALLRAVERRLMADGYTSAQLLVYTSNQRATDLYERLGWRPLGLPAPHPRTGKPEQRYELPL